MQYNYDSQIVVYLCCEMDFLLSHHITYDFYILFSSKLDGVSSITVSWGLKLLCYLLCLQGSDTEEKGVPVKCN